jgi:hypothetical protein
VFNFSITYHLWSIKNGNYYTQKTWVKDYAEGPRKDSLGLNYQTNMESYGGTAHKDSNSTSKGFLRTYIFQCRLAKVSKQNKPNEGFNTRSSQVLRLPGY